MEKQTVNPYILLAKAFCYPAPGRLAELQEGLEGLPEGVEGVKSALQAFVDKIERLPLGEWEELQTRTLDLDPPAAPYVGFQTWGETYQRGSFLAKMAQELAQTNVDLEGELPDHLVPVLRYLGQTDEPLPELVQVFPSAIQRMHSVLGKSDPSNSYLYLLEAVQIACKDLKKEVA